MDLKEENFLTDERKKWENVKEQLKTTCIFELSYDEKYTTFEYLQKKYEDIYLTQNIKKFFNILNKIIIKLQDDFQIFLKHINFDNVLFETYVVHWKQIICDLNIYVVYLLKHTEDDKKERKLMNCFDHNYTKCFSDIFFNSTNISLNFKKYITKKQIEKIDENLNKIGMKDIHLAFNHHINLV